MGQLRDNELASIIIPTRGSARRSNNRITYSRPLVIDAVASIAMHDYRIEYEIVIVHDSDADEGYLHELHIIAGDRLRVINFTPPFNFSAKANLGARHAKGKTLIFANDDLRVLTGDWLDQLVEIASFEDVGAVGAKLLFENGTIQHAGHYYLRRRLGHLGFHEEDETNGVGLNQINREVSGVTAACLAQRRSVWCTSGGFDERLPNNFNDVEYCIRLRERGFRIMQANTVRMTHLEGQTRDDSMTNLEVHQLAALLRRVPRRDPFSSPPDHSHRKLDAICRWLKGPDCRRSGP